MCTIGWAATRANAGPSLPMRRCTAIRNGWPSASPASWWPEVCGRCGSTIFHMPIRRWFCAMCSGSIRWSSAVRPTTVRCFRRLPSCSTALRPAVFPSVSSDVSGRSLGAGPRRGCSGNSLRKWSGNSCANPSRCVRDSALNGTNPAGNWSDASWTTGRSIDESGIRWTRLIVVSDWFRVVECRCFRKNSCENAWDCKKVVIFAVPNGSENPTDGFWDRCGCRSDSSTGGSAACPRERNRGVAQSG